MRQTPRLTRFLSKVFSLLSTFFLIFGPNLADYVTAANDESFWSQNNQPLLRGFNNEAVTYVSTTKSNGIWLATDASIYNYSAAQFARIDISYSTFPQIPSSRIRSILEGRDGRTLLFSILDGIYELDAAEFTFRRILAPTDSLHAEVLSVSHSRELDLAALRFESGYLLFDLSTANFSSGEKQGAFQHLSAGEVIGFDQGFYHIDAVGKVIGLVGSESRFREVCSTSERNVVSWAASNSGEQLAILDAAGNLSRYAVNQGECHVLSKQLVPAPITSGEKVSWFSETGVFAVITNSGLFTLDARTGVLSSTNGFIESSEVVLAAAEVGPDRIWIGSFFGAAELARGPIAAYRDTPNEVKPEFVAITPESSLQETLVATRTSLYTLDSSNLQAGLRLIKNVEEKGVITSLGQASDGENFIGFSSGEILSIDSAGNLRECLKVDGDSQASPISSIRASTQGRGIIATSVSGDLIRLKECSDQVSRVHQSFDNEKNRLIGAIEHGTHSYLVDLEGIVTCSAALESSSYLLTECIRSPALAGKWGVVAGSGDPLLFYSSDGEIVDSDGVSHLKAFGVYTSSAPRGEIIYSAAIDKSGRFWLGGSSGIWLVDGDSPTALVIDTKQAQSSSIDYGVVTATRDGQLLFGGVGALFLIANPMRFPRKIMAKIAFSAVVLDGESFERKFPLEVAALSLKSSKSRLSIELTWDQVKRHSAGPFQHQLLGLEKDWIETGPNNTVTYTNLPPGEYVFKARGAGPDGIWSTNTLEILVIVDYPWWRTYWAYALYVALALLVFRQLKQLHEERVTRELKLRHAAETEIAFQRLEDSFQAQQERNQAIEQSASENSNATLGLISLINEALSAREASDRKARFEAALESVQVAEALGENRINGKFVDLKELANEVGNQIQATQSDLDLIFVNDVPEIEVDEPNAKSIAVVLSELMTLGVHRLENETDQPVLLHLHLGVSPLDENHRISYSISIDGNPKSSDWADEIGRDAPITKLITEQIGGEILMPVDAEPLQVSLLLDAP